ncbi:MAG TPA: valine--tRNA ligase [Candidatus Fraserbacteria bacterium]|nr:valine--tRNA ligase [Candidatus Fraserbacteria bacterium]
MSLPKTYQPQQREAHWYAYWEQNGYFHSQVDPAKQPFTVALPLPNVTGELHIGHASTFSLQDLLIRWRRMQGKSALWQPGTDHAGIATQNVVERQLAREGLTREQLGREAFVERVWQWKAQYGEIIVGQLKRMGFSCDWERFTFTLDPAYAEAVGQAFIRLYREGYIYRGKYLVNWCPRCQTSISDLEVQHEESDGQLWYVRYQGAEGGPGVVIATTRPETIPADVAVAVHPDDPRYTDLVGQKVLLPLTDRPVPLIADSRVDPEFGTGALKITPGHDPLDYQIGQDHGLPTPVILDKTGQMTPESGKYAGLDRFAARQVIGEELQALGLIEKVEPYRTSLGHCDRCHTVIEPRISEQWFCRMSELARPALAAIRAGRVRYHAPRWGRISAEWLEGIHDWCISRQLWWGHQIPIWYCACGELIPSQARPPSCPRCGGQELHQDPDVLDTWFSSALWPFATLGWPRETPELDYFYPTDVLVTDRGILFLWVARMIIFGLHFRGELPFSDVYVSPTVLTLEGQRMSKSLGTGLDPLEMIEGRDYGADAVRFALVSRCSQAQQDLRFGEKMIEDVRNFNTKIWNAARFVLLNLEGFDHQAPQPAAPALSLADRWILSRYTRLVQTVTGKLESFEFDGAARQLYDFIWGDYCDWYLEMAKIALAQPQIDQERRAAVQHTLWSVLEGTLRLLHPIMPFITEEIWQRLPHSGPSIMIAPWPSSEAHKLDPAAEEQLGLLQELVGAVRTIRSQFHLAPRQRIPVLILSQQPQIAALLDAQGQTFRGLTHADRLQVGAELQRPPQAARRVTSHAELFVPLEGLIDLDQERQRLRRELHLAQGALDGAERRLDDARFLAKAPPAIVAKERAKKEEFLVRVERLRENLALLEAGVEP